MEAFAKLALMPVLMTAELFPLALLVVNVGYTVVAVEVFCSRAAALVALVALVAAPLSVPTNVVAVIALLARFALIPDTVFSA